MRLVGFLAFNPASTFSITDGDDLVMAHASATTLLAAAGAGVGGVATARNGTEHTELVGIKDDTLW
jgi:ammonia channel protein AmtB